MMQMKLTKYRIIKVLENGITCEVGTFEADNFVYENSVTVAFAGEPYDGGRLVQIIPWNLLVEPVEE